MTDSTENRVQINEQTRLVIPIVLLVIVIGAIITGTIATTRYVTTIKAEQEAIKKSVVTLENELKQETLLRKEADDLIEKEQESNRKIMIDYSNSIIEIKTDLKWIRAVFENKDKNKQ
jgi:hypothetical protein